jgi:hypothetical protein
VSHQPFATSPALIALALTLGCSAQAGNGGASGTLHVAVSSRTPLEPGVAARFSRAPSRCTPSLSAAANATAILCGDDVVVLRKVSVVLRTIELERADVAQQDVPQMHEVETGPIRFDLPLGVTTVAHVVTVNGLVPGRYDKLDFEIHRPAPVEDAVFVLRNPDLVGVSVRVEGAFGQGNAATNFVYTSDLEAEREEGLSLVVPERGSVGVTLRLDVANWFVVDGGLINPQTANQVGPNERAVRDNIRGSVKAFRDDDQNGREDNGGRNIAPPAISAIAGCHRGGFCCSLISRNCRAITKSTATAANSTRRDGA